MTERPLSPYLQTYRLPVTAVLSISHRVTGVILLFGMVIGVAVLLATAAGEERFLLARDLLRSSVGQVGLWLWIYAFLFHLCHGARHLLWDTGFGYSREHLRRNAALEVAASLALTLAVLLATLTFT